MGALSVRGRTMLAGPRPGAKGVRARVGVRMTPLVVD
jgi:hypothetical protein